MITNIVSRVLGGRRGGPTGTAGTGRAMGGGLGRGVGGGVGRGAGGRTKDEAVGRGVRSLLRRVR